MSDHSPVHQFPLLLLRRRRIAIAIAIAVAPASNLLDDVRRNDALPPENPHQRRHILRKRQLLRVRKVVGLSSPQPGIIIRAGSAPDFHRISHQPHIHIREVVNVDVAQDIPALPHREAGPERPRRRHDVAQRDRHRVFRRGAGAVDDGRRDDGDVDVDGGGRGVADELVSELVGAGAGAVAVGGQGGGGGGGGGEVRDVGEVVPDLVGGACPVGLFADEEGAGGVDVESFLGGARG